MLVHRATPDKTGDNETYIDDPSTNQAQDAVLSVTPLWGPGGGAGTYDDYPVSTRYDINEEKWVMLNTVLCRCPRASPSTLNSRRGPRPPDCYATELSYEDAVFEKVSYRPFANRNPSPNAFFVQPSGVS